VTLEAIGGVLSTLSLLPIQSNQIQEENGPIYRNHGWPNEMKMYHKMKWRYSSEKKHKCGPCDAKEEGI